MTNPTSLLLLRGPTFIATLPHRSASLPVSLAPVARGTEGLQVGHGRVPTHDQPYLSPATTSTILSPYYFSKIDHIKFRKEEKKGGGEGVERNFFFF